MVRIDDRLVGGVFDGLGVSLDGGLTGCGELLSAECLSWSEWS